MRRTQDAEDKPLTLRVRRKNAPRFPLDSLRDLKPDEPADHQKVFGQRAARQIARL